MKNNFLYHLSESIKEYKYRVRTLSPIDDSNIDLISRVIDCYNPVEEVTVTKTPIQDSPMDFPNYEMVPVYVVDITLKVPVSTYILQNKLRSALNISNSTIIVRMENDPLELETLRLDNFGNWDEREPLLSTNPVFHEYNYEADKVPPYGDEYNQKFLKFLASVEKTKTNFVYDYVQPENMSKDDFPIVTQKLDSDATSYNKDKDCVLPVYPNQVTDDEPEAIETAIHGNFDSISRLASKIIKGTKNG